jgi:hypothetical protein
VRRQEKDHPGGGGGGGGGGRCQEFSGPEGRSSFNQHHTHTHRGNTQCVCVYTFVFCLLGHGYMCIRFNIDLFFPPSYFLMHIFKVAILTPKEFCSFSI